MTNALRTAAASASLALLALSPNFALAQTADDSAEEILEGETTVDADCPRGVAEADLPADCETDDSDENMEVEAGDAEQEDDPAEPNSDAQEGDAVSD